MSIFYLVLCDLRWKQIEAITNLNSVSIDSLFVASTAHQILSIIQEIANYAARSHWIILVPQSTIDNWIRYFYNFWKSLFTMDHSFLNYSIWRAETENQSSLIELKLNPNQVDFLEIINKYYVMFCSEFLERISLLLFESHPISLSKFIELFFGYHERNNPAMAHIIRNSNHKWSHSDRYDSNRRRWECLHRIYQEKVLLLPNWII